MPIEFGVRTQRSVNISFLFALVSITSGPSEVVSRMVSIELNVFQKVRLKQCFWLQALKNNEGWLDERNNIVMMGVVEVSARSASEAAQISDNVSRGSTLDTASLMMYTR